MIGLAPKLLEVLPGGVACHMADWIIKLAFPQLRLRRPRRSLSTPAGIGGTGGTVSSWTSVSDTNLDIVGDGCAPARPRSCDGDVGVDWSAKPRYAGCIPKSGAWYEWGRPWKAFGISGTSVGVAVHDVVDTREVVLGKVALTDLGRDRERRNGDEKRRRLFDPSRLPVVVKGWASSFSVVVGVDIDSSSLEASRECAESYIKHQSALRLRCKEN